MIIIYPACEINKYIELGVYPHLKIPAICPTCHEKSTFKRIGYYKRWANTGQEEYFLRIGRVQCKNCKTSHALLPAFLLPGRQNTVKVVAMFLQKRIIEGKTLKKSIEESTPQSSRQKCSSWIKSLQSKLLEIQHYTSTFFNRFDVEKNLFESLITMLLQTSKDVSSSLSFHSFRFHQLTQKSLI